MESSEKLFWLFVVSFQEDFALYLSFREGLPQ
jgi:hypothetical protein